MARDLTGMFAQMNKAIAGNPLANGGGQDMLDMASQGFGQMGGAATGASPYSFMNEGGRKQQAQEDLAKQDLTTLEGLQEAARVYQNAGDPEKAMQMAVLAEKKKQQQQATLTQGMEDIRKGSARTKAAALAMSRGDKTAHAALVGNFLEPEEYISSVLEEQAAIREEEREAAEKDRLGETGGYTLSAGQIRYGDNNEEVARGPAEVAEEKPVPVYVERAAFESAAEAQAHSTNAAQADMLVQDLEVQIQAGAGPSGGALATGEEAFRKMLGSPDAVSNLKVRYYGLRNSAAVANLPPGSASDADVRLALQGWPGDNAPLQQIQSFLRGYSKMEKAAAEYAGFKTDYIGTNRTTLGVQSAWRANVAEQATSIDFNSLPKD